MNKHYVYGTYGSYTGSLAEIPCYKFDNSAALTKTSDGYFQQSEESGPFDSIGCRMSEVEGEVISLNIK